MKQTVGNACGTIGLLHAVGNITSEIKLGKLLGSNTIAYDNFHVIWSFQYLLKIIHGSNVISVFYVGSLMLWI